MQALRVEVALRWHNAKLHIPHILGLKMLLTSIWLLQECKTGLFQQLEVTPFRHLGRLVVTRTT
jgi:hypothetical protein